MTNNRILETLKENDIVMIEIPSMGKANVKEICRIYNIKFKKAEGNTKLDWLEFDGEILYTNIKIHKSMINDPIGNCMAITQKLSKEELEQIARVNDMWKADKYLLSDAELEHKRNLLNSMYNIM